MTYDEAVEQLRQWNREMPRTGYYAAFSGPGIIVGKVDPTLPYGVVRNGDGRLFDVLYPHERADHPLPDGWRAHGAEVEKE